nr:hypothetical protein GCM10025732_34540 [Glycomyces mayteni]
MLDHVGLNHLTWETGVRVDGRDVLPDLLAAHRETVAEEVDLPAAVFADGRVPSYYLRYFYAHDQEVAHLRTAPSRGQEVARIEAELWRIYEDDTLDRKPDLLSRRGGAYYSEAAVALMRSLLAQDGAVHAVNVRNRGFLPYLPDEAVIEVSARVGAAITPVDAAPSGPGSAASSRPSRPTRNWACRPRSTAASAASTRRCSRTPSSASTTSRRG